jgi:hypothetical protein
MSNRSAIWLVPVVIVAIVCGVFAGTAVGRAFDGRKQQLSRDDVYYEIVNDNGDHGNYIETYRLPNGRNGKVYCIVYSDQMKGGGGAGIDCDWAHSTP